MPPAKRTANRLPRDAYTLTIRQSPEVGKAPGSKEKDRKPIDPPPIIQLQIRDYSDPAQNYLQSPYYMCICSLWDPSKDEAAEEPGLSGMLVSSLHRLKDTDNTDAGFFVFPDLTVKNEGEYRLKFVLWEVLDKEMESLQSVISKPLKVHPPRTFPGLSESTFLTRTFGDQGVKMRIRKENRTTMKRAHSESENQAYTAPENSGMAPHPGYGQTNPYPGGGYGVDYTNQLVKRQKSGAGAYADRDAWAYSQASPSSGMYTNPSHHQLHQAASSGYYSEPVSGPPVDYNTFRTPTSDAALAHPPPYYRAPMNDYSSQSLPYHNHRSSQQPDGTNGTYDGASYGSMTSQESQGSPAQGAQQYRYANGHTLPPISTAAPANGPVMAPSPNYSQFATDGRYANGVPNGRPVYNYPSAGLHQ